MTQWWSDRLLDEFEKRADCFVRQYAAYRIDANRTVTPRLT